MVEHGGSLLFNLVQALLYIVGSWRPAAGSLLL